MADRLHNHCQPICTCLPESGPSSDNILPSNGYKLSCLVHGALNVLHCAGLMHLSSTTHQGSCICGLIQRPPAPQKDGIVSVPVCGSFDLP